MGMRVLESLMDTVAGAALMGRAQEETTEGAWVLGEDREGANGRVRWFCLCGGEIRRGVGSTPSAAHFLLLLKPGGV